MIFAVEEKLAVGPFSVDLGSAKLVRDGVELKLRAQAFRTLGVLVRNRGRLVSYPQLIHEAWGGIRVSQHTIVVTVNEVKSALGEYGSWIICRPTFGYSLEIPKSDDLMRRGWHFWHQYSREGLESALRCFQQAVQSTPADFRAFQAIANTYLTLAVMGLQAPRLIHGSFLEAQSRAAALCGWTPELRLDHAFGLFVFDRNFAAAESELLTLRKERPNHPYVPARLAMLYSALGRLDDALTAIRRARAIDPLVPALAIIETCIRIARREFETAAACGKEAVELHPNSQAGRALYAEALEFSGQPTRAGIEYRLASSSSPDIPWKRALEARFLARNGSRGDALEILKELESLRATQYVDSYSMALLLDAIGERDQAFQELDRAYEENSFALTIVNVDPKSDPLRSDPRFARLRKKVFGHPFPLSAHF